jgi:hypothetical protein
VRDPDRLRLLHRLARTYGTHPGAVLRWSPEDVAIGVACLELRGRERKQERQGAERIAVVGEW